MEKFSWFNSSSFHPDSRADRNGYVLILISHITFLLPIVISIITEQKVWFIIILIIQIVFSFLYHLYYKNNMLRIIDWLLAIILCITIIHLLFSNFNFTKVIIILLLSVVSLKPFISFEDYAVNHSIWHAITAIIATVVQY